MDTRRKTFDVETTFANMVQTKRKRNRKFRGPDSPLCSSIYPVFCITKFFGFAPYGFTRDQLTPSNRALIFSFFFLSVYTYILYVVSLKLAIHKRKKVVLDGTESSKVFLNYTAMLFEMLRTVFSRGTFVKIWNALQDFDESTRQLGYTRKETRAAIATWTLLIMQTVIWLAVNRLGMYAFSENWVYNVSYMSIYVATGLAVYKFVGVVFLLGQRFHRLNEIAVENLPPRSGCKTRNVSKKTIQDLHNELMVAGETLNSYYSWSLLLWLGNLSMHSVSNLYFIINWAILTSWTETTWPLISCFSAWLLVFLCQLLMIHVACDYATVQANRMGAIVTEWNVRIIRSLREDAVGTTLQFLHRRLHFSAGGCFNVNLSLLRSITAVLTTYLVILLQLPE